MVRKLHVAGSAIMLAWLATLGWQVRRVYFGGGVPGQISASARMAPGTRFYAAFAGGVQVGTASLTADTSATGVRLSERLDFAVTPGASVEHHTLDLALSPSLMLQSWTYRRSGVPDPATVTGTRRADGRFEAELSRGDRNTLAMSFSLGTALPAAAAVLRHSLTAPFAEGDSVLFRLVDPTTGALSSIILHVAAPQLLTVADSARFDGRAGRWVVAHTDTVRAWLLEEPQALLPFRIWVDALGFPVRAVLPNGLMLDRTAFEIAQLNLRDGHPATLATSPEPLRLASLGNQPDPVIAADTMASLVFPRDSAVMAVTRSAMRGATSREDTARQLARWASRRRVVDTGADDVPAALRGGWTSLGRARTMVAMARAAGLPARLAVAVSPAGQSRRARLVPQFFIDGWHAADPARGSFPADSTDTVIARRVSGRPADYLPLMPLLPESRP